MYFACHKLNILKDCKKLLHNVSLKFDKGTLSLIASVDETSLDLIDFLKYFSDEQRSLKSRLNCLMYSSMIYNGKLVCSAKTIIRTLIPILSCYESLTIKEYLFLHYEFFRSNINEKDSMNIQSVIELCELEAVLHEPLHKLQTQDSNDELILLVVQLATLILVKSEIILVDEFNFSLNLVDQKKFLLLLKKICLLGFTVIYHPSKLYFELFIYTDQYFLFAAQNILLSGVSILELYHDITNVRIIDEPVIILLAELFNDLSTKFRDLNDSATFAQYQKILIRSINKYLDKGLKHALSSGYESFLVDFPEMYAVNLWNSCNLPQHIDKYAELLKTTKNSVDDPQNDDNPPLYLNIKPTKVETFESSLTEKSTQHLPTMHYLGIITKLDEVVKVNIIEHRKKLFAALLKSKYSLHSNFLKQKLISAYYSDSSWSDIEKDLSNNYYLKTDNNEYLIINNVDASTDFNVITSDVTEFCDCEICSKLSDKKKGSEIASIKFLPRLFLIDIKLTFLNKNKFYVLITTVFFSSFATYILRSASVSTLDFVIRSKNVELTHQKFSKLANNSIRLLYCASIVLFIYGYLINDLFNRNYLVFSEITKSFNSKKTVLIIVHELKLLIFSLIIASSTALLHYATTIPTEFIKLRDVIFFLMISVWTGISFSKFFALNSRNHNEITVILSVTVLFYFLYPISTDSNDLFRCIRTYEYINNLYFISAYVIMINFDKRRAYMYMLASVITHICVQLLSLTIYFFRKTVLLLNK